MKKVLKMLPFLLINILSFYLLPLIIKDTGTAMLVLLVIIPFTCFITSFIYGIKNKFNFLYSVLVSILFIPTIFIFYNHTAAPYVIGFLFISLIGNFIGELVNKKRK